MSAGPVSDRAAMIAQMDPVLDAGVWCFVTASDPSQMVGLMGQALGSFRESEGLSLIVPHDVALEAGFDAAPYARITLQVHSALDGVGLTAAVSSALSDAGIPCNMVAAYHHDHVFVPYDRGEEALDLLRRLASGQA